MIRKLTGVVLAGLLVAGFSLTLSATDAEGNRGSVRHGSKKGAQRGAQSGAKRGATSGYARTGTEEGAKKGAAVGSSRGAAQGARTGAKAGAVSSPGGPGGGSSRAAYRAGYSHGRYRGWKDARREWRRWRAFTGLVKLGVYYSTRPKTSTTVVVTGTTYYYAGGVYYVPSESGYVVTSAPPGAVVYAVPTYTTVVYAGSEPYHYANGAYYIPTDAPAQQPVSQETTVNISTDENEHEAVESVEMIESDYNYEVAAPPVGATVPYLPDEAEEQSVGGKTYFVYSETYYRPFVSDGETIYMVVEDPRAA